VSEGEIVPNHLTELRRVLADTQRVLPVGNGTKQPLCQTTDSTRVSLRSLRGIIEYEPSEFTFTAWAGTTLLEIVEALRDKRQYLPFDPMLVEAGATIGGTIASGLSGPGRFRYGGVRDFIIGVKLLAGDGDLVQGGGKVVKNAAGFDIPKFLVGSLGRYALMVEVSFKVFPQPPSMCTLRFDCDNHEQAIQRIAMVACSGWEADAIDYRASERIIYVRLAGPDGAIDRISTEIRTKFSGGELLTSDQAHSFWHSVTELNWSGFDRPLIVKVPTIGKRFLAICPAMQDRPGVSSHLSVAGGVCWIALDSEAHIGWLDGLLKSQLLAGLVVRGQSDRFQIGQWTTNQMQLAVKRAMDPQAKFAGV